MTLDADPNASFCLALCILSVNPDSFFPLALKLKISTRNLIVKLKINWRIKLCYL
jgi:hypothetical protein